MPSPFPGMNPYLEQRDFWSGFHSRFIPAAAEAIARQVLPDYFVEIEERLYLSDWPDDDATLVGVADLAVRNGKGRHRPDRPDSGGVATLEAPSRVRIPPTTAAVKSRYLKIRDLKNGDRVVTVLEVLSPSNKLPGKDRAKYLRKRKRVLESRTHLVEIDLLRVGERMPMVGMRPCDYLAFVSRSQDRPDADQWPFALRSPLCPIAIPLRIGDREVSLDLKAVLDRVYDGAGYQHVIYRRPPVPPLTPEDQAWAEGILQSVVPA